MLLILTTHKDYIIVLVCFNLVFMADLRTEIAKIFDEIDKDLQNDKENSMTIYECFDFQEEDNRKIASSINDAINEIVCCGDKGLHSFRNAISYCDYRVVVMILDNLEQKKLITPQLLELLKKNLEEAHEMYQDELQKRTRPLEEVAKDFPYLDKLMKACNKKV